MKKIAILQSNYIPWKGYFDIIHQVDEFILYDEVQYTKNDWRNRNQIKTNQGVKWLTIPVNTSGKGFPKISDIFITDIKWRKKHWQSLSQAYSKAPFFLDYKEQFESLYLSEENSLSKINYSHIININSILGINTTVTWSNQYDLKSEEKTEKLVELCRKSGATTYLSGPSAKDYMNEELFAENNIKIEYINYSGYPEYDQLSPPFAHQVSVVDLIFMKGPDSGKYIWDY